MEELFSQQDKELAQFDEVIEQKSKEAIISTHKQFMQIYGDKLEALIGKEKFDEFVLNSKRLHDHIINYSQVV